jgi:formylmethanofuran dehydrogenase subunit B
MTTQITEVPSPFCGFGIDDLTVSINQTEIQLIENGCAINTPAFEHPISDTHPRIRGKKSSLSAAIQHVAQLLMSANQPVIGGCATDVEGMRELLAVADKIGAVVDNVNFVGAKRNLLAMQDSGWMNTTLAEVKNRCDLLLIIHCDLEKYAPRFFQKYLWNEAMFVDPSQRQIIYLGQAPSGTASTSPNGQAAQVLPCEVTDLVEVIDVLRALLKGRKLQISEIGGISISALQQLADQLKQAKYAVITWASATLTYSQAELTVQSICDIVKTVNQSGTRCSGLPLVGKEGEQTANQVCGWTTGYPARMRFSSGFPEYDPFLYDSQSMLNNGEVDVLLWVHAFNHQVKPPETDIPTIVFARSGMTFSQEPEIFIPIGTPGIDHAGHAYRLDNVVAIRLKQLRDSGLPSTAQIFQAIYQVLLQNEQ